MKSRVDFFNGRLVVGVSYVDTSWMNLYLQELKNNPEKYFPHEWSVNTVGTVKARNFSYYTKYQVRVTPVSDEVVENFVKLFKETTIGDCLFIPIADEDIF